MAEHEHHTPDPQAEGSLQPPPRKPPTAIGARTPEPDDHPVKEIIVPIGTGVRDLAILMRVPVHRTMWAAFSELGRLVTINQVLPFSETKALAAHFGFSARRPAGQEEQS